MADGLGATEPGLTQPWGSAQMWRAIVDGASDIVVVTTAGESGTRPEILYVNQAFTALTGYRAEDIVGQAPGMLQGAGTDPAARARIRAALDARQSVSETLLNYDRWGREIWLDLRISPLLNDQGEATHFVAFERDVTDRVRAEAGLRQQVIRDGLTNLANRTGFLEVLAGTLSATRASGQQFALVYLDLDDFKEVNDTHGHSVGDSVLQTVANRLQACVRQQDLAARLSGDEFALLLHAGGDATSYSRLVARVVEAVGAPITVGSVTLQIEASAGLAVFPHDGTTAQELLDVADEAMYRVKRSKQWARTAVV